MTLEIYGHSFAYNMEHILRIFYPARTITHIESPLERSTSYAISTLEEEQDSLLLTATLFLDGFAGNRKDKLPRNASRSQRRRALSGLLFQLLVEQSGRKPPWGTLIGVRPVRMLGQLLKEEKSREEAARILEEEYYVSPQKTALAFAVYDNQRQLLEKNHSKAFSLYLSIPFCPSRCHYCSFVSHSIERTFALVPEYVERLQEEIQQTAEIANELGLELQTIYFGGGTPTTLAPEQLRVLLKTIEESFSHEHLVEYTVEAGRPDTITEEKLRLLLDFGVNRISINPQTMENHVLDTIGRSHTVEQTVGAFHMARRMGFSIINMDLIAGLPGESPASYLDGLEKVIQLAPENITVHTLTIKRSSHLWGEGEYDIVSQQLPESLEAGRELLMESGYQPYYLYRQKGTMENLENIGYGKEGHFGYYNIYSMEEVHTILAVGAGGVTKLCAPPNTIERIYNHKYPYEYLSDFAEIKARKSAIRSFYERNQ